jgi:hypothetical protein
MTANYKTSGTKEFKKISYLKQLMMEDDISTRRQAMTLYNNLIQSEYDKTLEELEKELEKREKLIRLSEKKKLRDKSVKAIKKAFNDEEEEESEEVKEPDEPELDSSDKYLLQEISGIKFKIKYYNELKDIEIDKKLLKIKIKI